MVWLRGPGTPPPTRHIQKYRSPRAAHRGPKTCAFFFGEEIRGRCQNTRLARMTKHIRRGPATNAFACSDLIRIPSRAWGAEQEGPRGPQEAGEEGHPTGHRLGFAEPGCPLGPPAQDPPSLTQSPVQPEGPRLPHCDVIAPQETPRPGLVLPTLEANTYRGSAARKETSLHRGRQYGSNRWGKTNLSAHPGDLAARAKTSCQRPASQ